MVKQYQIAALVPAKLPIAHQVYCLAAWTPWLSSCSRDGIADFRLKDGQAFSFEGALHRRDRRENSGLIA
jgi:hypothetical protein